MNTPSHTPGPWHVSNGLTRLLIGGPNYAIASMSGIDRLALADARLIAAAPDLLAALREVVAEADAYEAKHGQMRRPWVRIARAAIAKAEGPA